MALKNHNGATQGYEQYALFDYRVGLSILLISLVIAAVL